MWWLWAWLLGVSFLAERSLRDGMEPADVGLWVTVLCAGALAAGIEALSARVGRMAASLEAAAEAARAEHEAACKAARMAGRTREAARMRAGRIVGVDPERGTRGRGVPE